MDIRSSIAKGLTSALDATEVLRDNFVGVKDNFVGEGSKLFSKGYLSSAEHITLDSIAGKDAELVGGIFVWAAVLATTYVVGKKVVGSLYSLYDRFNSK
jgi:hypothetical protein